MINNIKNNTISEVDTKKKINELNKIKKVETNGKRLIKSQQKLLSWFDNLKTNFNNNKNSNNNESESNNKNVNENVNVNVNVNENENVNENVNKNENESDDGQYYLEQISNNFKKIDEAK